MLVVEMPPPVDATRRRSVTGSAASYYSDAEDFSFSCEGDATSSAVSDAGSGSLGYEFEAAMEEQETGTVVVKMVLVEPERECRICHMGLDGCESGGAIELGCACKNELGWAHKQCAETWFKIRGNKTCEICQSVAHNVISASEIGQTDLSTEAHVISTPMAAAFATIPHSETRGFWHGHRFINFLLACVVFAFVMSWLFHFNVPSS